MTEDPIHDNPIAPADHHDDEAIRARAYEISERPDAGSAEENWARAAAELEAERESAGESDS